jgi:chemotaxis protein histidine kinase CheA
MFFGEKLECSEQAKYQINYNRMAQTQMNTMTLSANSIVEKCLAKMANDVTEQVRDKLIDIIIAVLGRECDDFDGEAVRRLIVTELEMTPVTFTLEKRGAAVKESKPKTLKEKVPKEPKEKALKAVLSEEEREFRKAAKKAERQAEKEAVKAAKKVEREAAKTAKKAERAAAKEANKDVDKEAAKATKLAEKEAEKAAKLAEREAVKVARKAEKDAEREAAKAAKQAEKEAAKAALPAPAPKEQRLPIPWCGKRIEGRCEALRVYHGLFAQCTSHSAPPARNRARNSELAPCVRRAVCLTTLTPAAKSASDLQT